MRRRGRFNRKVQLAQLCLSIGQPAVAFPILGDLAQEVEQRRLGEWEPAEDIAHTLTLLFRCMEKLGADAVEKRRIYDRICCLDPVQAMSCSV